MIQNLFFPNNSDFRETFSSASKSFKPFKSPSSGWHLMLEGLGNNVNTIIEWATLWPLGVSQVMRLNVSLWVISCHEGMQSLSSCSSQLNREVLWDSGDHTHWCKTDLEPPYCAEEIVTQLIMYVSVSCQAYNTENKKIKIYDARSPMWISDI